MPGELKFKSKVLNETQIRRILRRMAGQIVERNGGVEGVMLVGIRTRGVPMAKRLAAEIEALETRQVPIGVLDITLYRDDLSAIAPQPVVKETRLPGPIDDLTVVLCDDVLFTGRTIRSALDALIDFGRPQTVQLAVLIDRGGRELPIQADFVGRQIQAAEHETVEVRFHDTDGEDAVMLMEVVDNDG